MPATDSSKIFRVIPTATGAGRVPKWRVEGESPIKFSFTLADESLASLFASAPDLLAACEAAASEVDVLPFPNGQATRKFTLVQKLRAAIARAKGGVA